MFFKALLAFLILPCIVAGVAPAIIINFDPWRIEGFRIGTIIFGAGGVFLLRCVWDFYKTGKGTLAPWSPPKILVTVRLYRFVRNPMYVGVLTLVGGLAVRFGSPLLCGYWILLATAIQLRVILNEEPWLKSRFGDEWVCYSERVPRWLPRWMKD